MFDESQLKNLLHLPEGERLDFKATGYRLTDEESKHAFVKDILCMSNTPKSDSAFIVTGVKKFPDGSHELHGVNDHPDDADLQSQFTDRVSPNPVFTYHVVKSEGLEFGVLEIPPARIGPCVPNRDFRNLLRKGQLYFRQGSQNTVAMPHDVDCIYEWFREGRAHGAQSLLADDDNAWDTFLDAVDYFRSDKNYILVSSPYRSDGHTDLSALGTVPWIGAVDFDPSSDVDGLLSVCKPVLEKRRSCHLITSKDRFDVSARAGSYWYFARGLQGRMETVQVDSFKAWNISHGKGVTEFFEKLAASTVPDPVTCIALWYDPELALHLRATLESALRAFGETVDFVIVTKDTAHLETIAAESDATICQIPMHQVCSGLAMINADSLGGGEAEECYFPSKSGAPVSVSPERQRWLEEDFDLVHLAVGEAATPERASGTDFLSGAEISWYELSLHYDIDRDLTSRLLQRLRREVVEARRTSRVNLYHDPGAGGTTVALRAAWELHREVPCVVLRRMSDPRTTVERLFKVTALTDLPILALVDGSDVSEGQMDELYQHARSRQIPVVFLQVSRRFTAHDERTRTFHLPTGLSRPEAARFLDAFSRARPERKVDLSALLSSNDPHRRSAFYFGLTAFQQEFRGLPRFIAARINGLTRPQQRMMGFLSLAHHYAQQSLPAQTFADLLGSPRSRPVDLVTVFPEETMELLVQAEPKRWRTAHDLVATEIIKQLLSSGLQDSRLWQQNLTSWAVDFLQLCRGTDPVPGDALLDVVRRTFFYRDNVELLGTERSAREEFAELIQDIQLPEGRSLVLKEAVTLFPEEPHFWGHLGRFYSIELHDYDRALECIGRALELANSDHSLYHMRGMTLRNKAYDALGVDTELDTVLTIAKQASEAFESARHLKPDDEYAYISEVQMLARVLDRIGQKFPGGTLGYLASRSADPYLRDCLERAEDLLERVRRNREGEQINYYERACRAQLDALYGRHENALQTWDQLLSRGDVYGLPVRRQIVWTHLARHNRSWDSIPTDKIDRIIMLLEQNLQEEPHRDTNLRLWVQAVRRSSRPPSLDTIIEKVAYWRVSSGSLDATYYLYILYSLQAIDGSTLGRESALRYLGECRSKAQTLRNRTKSFEWLGQGSGIDRLIHHSQLGNWDPDREFWDNTSALIRLQGRISRIESQQAGQIEIPGGLTAFFVPAKGGYSIGRSENQPVTLYLGFSYDGLRAWEVRDSDGT